jgi:uncharacterized membrane protein
MKNVELEILQYNYWEHFKYAKDIALILPIGHPKRIAAEQQLDKLQQKINTIKHEKNRNNR